ncbi:hypothetical protein [Neptunomonas sp.]|uniref:hypothetical protein n=1 Tax=Neptunomonas sp. TaxID=1971898 RepID=UPI003569189E
MTDLFIFIFGAFIGGLVSFFIGYEFLIRAEQLNEEKFSYGSSELPYSVEKVWEFLTNSNLLSCYKAYEIADLSRDLSEGLQSVFEGARINTRASDVFINKCQEKSCLYYGMSPFSSDHAFHIYPLSSQSTLIELKRTVTPDDLLKRSTITRFIHFLTPKKHSVYQPDILANVTLSTIDYGLNRYYEKLK